MIELLPILDAFEGFYEKLCQVFSAFLTIFL